MLINKYVLTAGKDSNTSTGSNPPGPKRFCLSISSSCFASSICSFSFSIARFLILVLNASNSSSKAFRYSWSAIAILKMTTFAFYNQKIYFNLYSTIQGIVTYLEKNEDIHDRGSTSNCFANSKRYWTQIHWWATCSMAEHFSSNSKFKQWITK